MILSSSTNTKLLTSIANQPDVYREYNGCEGPPWHPRAEAFYIIGEHEGKIVGMIELYPLANAVVEAHIFILPYFWGTKIPIEFARKVMIETKKNTEFTKALTYVPANHKRALKFLDKIGFKKNSMIPEGRVYKDKLTDLFIYIAELPGE